MRKTITTAMLNAALLMVSLNVESRAGSPFETDDYGFPLQRDSISQLRPRSGKGNCANQRSAWSLRHRRDDSRGVYRHSRSIALINPVVIRSQMRRLPHCIKHP